jgi:hypothetical protein
VRRDAAAVARREPGARANADLEGAIPSFEYIVLQFCWFGPAIELDKLGR